MSNINSFFSRPHVRALALAAGLTILSTSSLFAQTTTTEDKREVKVTKDSGNAVVTTTHSETTVEEITARDHMIVVNPLKFFLFYNISYFQKLSQHVAVGGGFQIPSFRQAGFGLNAEARFYPGNHNLRGFYVAPNVSYNHVTVDDYYYDDGSGTSQPGSTSASATSIGVLIGWQWFPGDDFAIGLGIGIDNYWFSGASRGVSTTFSDLDGRVPAFRFDIGYGW